MNDLHYFAKGTSDLSASPDDRSRKIAAVLPQFEKAALSNFPHAAER
jgi:hypothetical protein